ncbi:hypothetical protein [Robertmurraya massiliosenegalensis]|uniref:hypothetical protein n=1 Tax=Robertmurraya massiliosenegalensis TaxID=1287657 RepID=UPI0002FCAC46|nr:hypothetical protein [Robertmurraya massiliosenegalensis]
MRRIISQPYVKVERKIKDFEQITMEYREHLHLYEDRIVTRDHVFLVKNVHDMSFRRFSSTEGVLYLHTNQGVFPYSVPKEPNGFIDEYKKLRG